MLDPEHLKAIKISAQREEWSAVGDTLRVLSKQAVGNPLDIVRIKSLVPLIERRSHEDLAWSVDELLRIQNGRDSN